MKAAFNILPPAGKKLPLHLLVEIGSYGVSLLWFTKDPFAVQGLAVYNFVNTASSENIHQIFGLQETSDVLSMTLCYNFKESLLVPEKYYDTALSSEALSLIFGEDMTAHTKVDFIKDANIYNIYRTPKNIESVFSQLFPRATVYHSASLQVGLLHGTINNNNLYCTVFHNMIKVILFQEGKLQVVQQFNYSSPPDVAYHLLNVCLQNDIHADTITLRLSGMIDGHSILYKELYAFFINIDFENIPEGIFIQEEMKMLPAHFFSHLTALASCVS